MSKVEVGERKRRGLYEEIVVRDTTRVTNPVAARIFVTSCTYLVVPENDRYPVVLRNNLSSAVSFVEQIIPDEGRSF